MFLVHITIHPNVALVGLVYSVISPQPTSLGNSNRHYWASAAVELSVISNLH
jgi:hypothetical protein